MEAKPPEGQSEEKSGKGQKHACFRENLFRAETANNNVLVSG